MEYFQEYLTKMHVEPEKDQKPRLVSLESSEEERLEREQERAAMDFPVVEPKKLRKLHELEIEIHKANI